MEGNNAYNMVKMVILWPFISTQDILLDYVWLAGEKTGKERISVS